jgi:hypothetical protein
MKNEPLNTAKSIANAAGSGGKTSLQLALLALLCAGLLAGCEQIRKATYPSDFVYLEQKQVRGEMALLSLYLRQLDQILLDDSTVSSEQQERILAILTKISHRSVQKRRLHRDSQRQRRPAELLRAWPTVGQLRQLPQVSLAQRARTAQPPYLNGRLKVAGDALNGTLCCTATKNNLA